MGNLKISEDLFLEKQELNRLKKFLEFDGFKQEFLLNSTQFGIVKGYNIPNGLNILPKNSFLVDNVGAASYTVNIGTGRAVNKFADILTLDVPFNLTIPNTGLWYWIKIKYQKVNYELGTVNIDINGNMTGTGTFFTEVLRGQPNFTTKIRFTNTIGNYFEYDVVDVISDTSAILSGDFLAENDLKYGVVGTFTPGFVPANADKMIYEYDSVLISLVAEDPYSLNVQPAKTNGEEFYLARVKTSGLNVEIQDKRLEFWETRAEYEMHFIDRAINPIIGVESVKWNLPTTARDENEINISWGYRTKNWTVDTTQNIITINTGLGGILKEGDVSKFVNGMFDGWRIYSTSGKYSRITSSTKTGTFINIKLDYLDINLFSTPGEELHIVPDVEEIEIKTSWDAAVHQHNIIEERFVFPIYFSTGKVYVRILDATTTYLYNIKFRYKTVREYTDWTQLPSDTIGFYAETSFDDYGILKTNPIDRVLKPYVSMLNDGFIEIVPNPDNWNIIFNQLLTGDVFGIEHQSVSNVTPVVQLTVGINKQHQVLNFSSVTLANDININLNKVRADGTPCINGNRFIIQIEGAFELNGRNLRICTDYVNPGSLTPVREIQAIDQYFIKQNQRLQRSGLVMMFTYDGTDWWLSISNEMNGVPKGTIVSYAGSSSEFDSTGLGIGTDVLGWALCNGNTQAGVVTKNLKGKVIAGYDALDAEYAQGATGGFKYITIGAGNLPSHQHTYSGTTNGESITHTHPYNIHASKQVGENTGTGEAAADPSSFTSGGTTSPNSPDHTHTYSGTTDPGGGSGSVTPTDNRQPFIALMYIQKII